MSKPMIRKANPRTRSDRGPDTTIEEARSELIALLPKRQRLAYNPLTSARVVCQHGGFGLYCGDEGYFLVQPASVGFISVGVEVEDARHWAIVHNAEGEFDEYHENLMAVLRVHGVLL
jgi:hypothetical protein